MKRLTHWLIVRAATGVPSALSERLEEEWLADLGERRGGFARLRFALGCCRATRVIASDQLAAGVAAASSATASSALAALPLGHSFSFSRRTAMFLLIAGFHIVVIYCFARGFAQNVKSAEAPMVAVWMNQPKPHDLIQPLSPPKFAAGRLVDLGYQPPMHFPPDTDTSPDPQNHELTQQPLIPQHPLNPGIRVVGEPGRGFPDSDNYYPSSARRLGEAGSVAVRVCVDEKGRLTSNPVIAQSSGNKRLDEGALRLASAGSGHYQPTTENGRSVSDCYPFQIKFELRD